jgi:hypothetical protein
MILYNFYLLIYWNMGITNLSHSRYMRAFGLIRNFIDYISASIGDRKTVDLGPVSKHDTPAPLLQPKTRRLLHF